MLNAAQWNEEQIDYADIDTMIEVGLSDQEGAAFVFNDIFYYVLPSGFYQYDGTTVNIVTPYIPTALINCNPAELGSGDVLEDYNYLSNSWKQKYSYTDAATTVFYLAKDADSVKVYINGTETTSFTFDGVNKVTMTTAPGAGTNHVMIQGTKTGLMDANNILKCRHSAQFGGENDTRIFLTGNPDFPATVFRCDVMNPTYWPENSSGAIGNDSDKNTGLLLYYTNLLLFKERSIWRCDFSLVNGKAVFEWKPINSAIGCDIPKSIQLINNAPVFANTYAGVHILTTSYVRDEKNVVCISGNINGAPTRTGLLDEPKESLISASSVDYDGKYWFNVADKVYLWDYLLTPYAGNENKLAWFKWDNFNANVWLIRDRELYYGKRDIGNIAHLTKTVFTDFDDPIYGVWRSKLFHFGFPEWLKTIKEVYFRTREVMNTQITVNMLDREGVLVGAIPLISATFSWTHFSWATFTWGVRNVPLTFKLRPKLKKTIYFQLQIENNIPNQDMSIMDLEIYFTTTKKAR